MIKTCRLTISYKEESRDMETVLNDGLKKAGITMDKISVNGPTYGTKTHYGNWVLTPVLDNDATTKLAIALGTKTDLPRSILEESDIENMVEGAKVKVEYMSDFGFPIVGVGKIISKSNNKVTILKGGSRTKGWVFRPWDEVAIENI